MTSGLQQKNPGGWLLLKMGAGAKRGAPCCAANHSLCVLLGAVDRCHALVLGQTGHTLLSGEGARIALVTESSGALPIMPATAAFKGSA